MHKISVDMHTTYKICANGLFVTSTASSQQQAIAS